MEDQEFQRVLAGVEAVIKVAGRAAELHNKGHFARAAQKYADAAAAVHALDADPDNLVVARLQTLQMSSLGELSQAPGADQAAALRTQLVDLLPPVMTALERRRTAGTLDAACSRPVEVLWELLPRKDADEDIAVDLMQLCRAYGREVCGEDAPGTAAGGVSASLASVSALALGKVAYVWAASYSAVRLSPLTWCIFPLNPAEVAAMLAFVLHAVDMVLEPRVEPNARALEAESLFLSNLRVQVEKREEFARQTSQYPGAVAVAAATAPALQAAWRRVLDSGVLRARGIDDIMDVNARESSERAATAAASAAAHGLRACALPDCGAREVHVKQFRMCSACRGAVYCSREHQQLHWRAHKAACKAARAAAVAETEAEAQQ
jgi:hypothetical protein